MVLLLLQLQCMHNPNVGGEYLAYVVSALCMCGPFPGGRGRTPAESGCSDAAEGGNGSDDEAMGGDKAAPVGGSLSAEAEGGCGKPTASMSESTKSQHNVRPKAASQIFVVKMSLAPQVQPGKENLVVCLQLTPSSVELLC